jgi:hypothetical protein
MLRNLAALLFPLGLLNFLTFFCVAAANGGDAINGKIVDGKYFLGNHGQFTETSQAFYTYSLWHVRSLFLTVPLTFIGGLILFSLIKSQVLPSKNGN